MAFKTNLANYVQQFDSEEELENEEEKNYNSFMQSSFDDIIEGGRTTTLFILEMFMKRLGFIDSRNHPKASADLKDSFNKSYSTYDLLFVVILLYFGLCKESVISLPQLRADRITKKSRSNECLQRMKDLREEATSKLVTALQIRTMWRKIEPRLLQDQWNYCRMIRKKSIKEGEEGKQELLLFTRSRQEYFVRFGRQETSYVKDEKINKNKSQAVIDLREKIQAYQRGDVDDMSDSEFEE